MAIVVSDAGEIRLLDWAIAARSDLSLVLFKNNATLDGSTELSDLTPADFSGVEETDPALVFAPSTTAGGKAKSFAPSLTFTHDGGPTANTIHGYAVVYNGAEYLWGEKFATSKSMALAGDSITITPVLPLRSES
jgi:hypothetical protein